jgi:diguanylate cyclase (GGDEF)-like protein
MMDELERVEEKFGILDRMPVGVCVVREDFIVLFWNKCLEDWTFIPKSKIVGASVGDYFPHLLQPKYSSRLKQIFEGGPPTIFSSQLHKHLIPSRLPNEQLRIQHTTVTAVRRLTGSGFYALLVIEDVTYLTNRIQDYKAMRDRALAEIEERKQAQESLYQKTNELEQRNSDLTQLGQMSDLLQACLTVREAYTVIAQGVKLLFPNLNGGLFMLSASRKLVEAVVTWGAPVTTERIFTPNECWSLRRGQLHSVENTHQGLLCKHLHQNPLPAEYCCVPLMAQGEAMGVLYLSSSENNRLTEAKQLLAGTVSEQIALALANLKLRETLHNQSIRDPLTGLFNRRYLEDALQREVYRASRGQKTLGIIMLDVDYFKHFNDKFGHDAGDEVLRALSLFLQKQVRQSDIVCRYGGEEFLLILPEASLDITLQRAEQLRGGVKSLNIQYRSQCLGPVTLSIGVAIFPDHGFTGAAAIQAADAALYRAKNEGRDRVVTFS